MNEVREGLQDEVQTEPAEQAEQPVRVVVTGIGAVTPLGLNAGEFWEGVTSGRSGVARLTLIDPDRHTTQFGGEVSGFDPDQFIDRKESRRMDRVVQLAVVSADEALADSGLEIVPDNWDAVGVVVGCGIGGLATWEREYAKLLAKGPDRVSPFLIPMMIPNMAAGHVSIRSGARGPNTATVSACTSSGHALGLAFDLIKRGDAIAMITGGTEAPICDSALAGFGNMRALSRRNDDAERASRPFDVTRDGFVIGEGAGMVVLEEMEHAVARGAKIYGEMVSYGMTGDSYHITDMPNDGRGVGAAMQQALRLGGLHEDQIGYINAHGTSTPVNDVCETAAVKNVFGERAYKIPMSSTKSQIGHLLGAGTAVEVIATVLALRDQILPPTINYQNPDPECDLDYVPNEARPGAFDYALCNSSGFGGHNTCLAFKRWNP
jgi:3-oxoacyl-[acyl-carrier-protein] synthase II